jgi:diguanylate cyclase (GGDEF)-like protein
MPIDTDTGPRSLHALWRVWLPALILITALCGGLAFQLLRTESAGHSSLRDRFHLRTTLTAQFSQSFVDGLQTRERIQARRWLSARVVSPATFEQIAGAFGFTAAVLLDARGRVIASYPSDPALIGKDIAPTYPHLRAALHGHAAVSSTVLSAVKHREIVASAIPYATAYGRRVFSGGFDIGASPLGAYLRSTTAIPGSVFAINDGTGSYVTGSPNGISADTARAFDGSDSRGYYIARHAIAGTPWTVEALVPTHTLYSPLHGRNVLYWFILLSFATICVAALALLYRLMHSRESLKRLASVDPLTGAWNRRALDDAYALRTVDRARDQRGGALLLLDLDNFKEVNDVLGHAAGDDLLRGVVQALRSTLRVSDWIARIGGDEFAVLLPDADAETAYFVIRKIEQALGLVTVDGSRRFAVHASIGCALEPHLPATLAELLSEADAAMYREKQRPRNSILEPLSSEERAGNLR